MMNLPCFVCGQPVVGLQGQDYDWNTTLLRPDRGEDQRILDQKAFGPCHLLCLVHSEWGRFWAGRFLERQGVDTDDLTADGWRMLPGGDWTTTMVHKDGWLATVPHRSVRLAEPYADGMRMPIIEKRYEHLRRHPAVTASIHAAFAHGQAYPLGSFIDALDVRPYLTTPQALDRASMRPQPSTSRSEGGGRMGLTLAVIFSYDVWLSEDVFEGLRRSALEAFPPETDKLWQALEAADLPQVVSLLSRGVSPDAVSESRRTPLMFAAGEGYLDLVHALLSYGADINYRNPTTGGTALRDAAIQDDIMMVRLLLEHGANPELTDDLGETALSIAQDMGFVEVAGILQQASVR